MNAAEYKAASEILLHRSRHTESAVSVMVGTLLDELPESEETASLRDMLLHRWRHPEAAVSAALAKLLAAVKPAPSEPAPLDLSIDVDTTWK